MSLGLLMSTKLLRRRGPDLLAVHEVLSLSAIVAIVIHGVALLGDGYLKASLADIAVPFAFSYKTFWTSIGIIAGWGMAICSASATTCATGSARRAGASCTASPQSCGWPA